MIVNPLPNRRLTLGRLGENKVRVIRFDIHEMKAEFPTAEFMVLNRRPTESSAYPVSVNYVSVHGNHLDWTIQSGDLLYQGMGACEIVASVDDKIAKSQIWLTEVLQALDGAGTPPDPWASWVEDVENAADRAEAAAAVAVHAPQIEDGVWYVWDAEEGDYVSTGISAAGQDGHDGQDGYSPSASVSKSGSTATISITDKNGTTTATVSDGDPSAIIDDTAGSGDTDKVWSADKSHTLLSALQVIQPNATASDVGKALIVKTVDDGVPTSYEYGETGGGGAEIDDTAGAGDTDKVWSADKVVTEIQQIIVSGGVPIDDTAGKADTNKLWSAGKIATLLDYVRTVTPSKNLNVTPYTQSQEVNGLTFTTNEDNTVTVSGTATANTLFPSNDYNTAFRWLLPAGSYVLSGGKNLNQYVRVKLYESQNAQNAKYNYDSTSGKKTFTIESDMYAIVQINIVNGQVLSNPVTFGCQIETGSTATAYASPWPAVSESSVFDDIDERLDDLEEADTAFDLRLDDDESDIDGLEDRATNVENELIYNKEKFGRTGNLIQYKPVVGSNVNLRIDFESVDGFDSIQFVHCGENLIDMNAVINDGTTETAHGITATKNKGYIHVEGTEDLWTYSTHLYGYLSSGNWWLPKGHYAIGYGIGLAGIDTEENNLILQREFVSEYNWKALQFYVSVRGGNTVDFDYPLMLVAGDESPRHYKAFEGEKVTVSLPSTVYGGWIDINNSVLHITKTVEGGQLVPVTETTVDLDPITLSNIIGINTLYSVDGYVSAQGEKQLDYVKDYQMPVADFFLDNDYLLGKMERIRELMYGTAGTGDAFFFITDIHNECNRLLSFPVIREIGKYCKIPRLFCGGDVADGLYNRMMEVYDLLEHCYKGEIHYTMGNHEWMSHTTGDELAFWSDMGKKEQIGNTDRHYYYVDNPQQKIRYVVMSSCAEDENGDSWDWGYEQAQQDWLENVALDVESGWGIILFTHIAYMIDWETGEKLTEPKFTPIENILNNYNGNGEIIAVIAGHAHCDGVFHTSAGIPIVVTTCDKGQAYLSRTTGDADMDASIRIINTPSEQAFDVAVLDRENKELHMVRIGCKAWNNVDGVIDTDTPFIEERVISYDRT